MVRWVGWPDKFNEWLPAESLTDINHSAEQSNKENNNSDIAQRAVNDATVEPTGDNDTIDENKDLEDTPPNMDVSKPQNEFYEPYNSLDTSGKQIKKQTSDNRAHVRHRSMEAPRRGKQNITSDRVTRRQKRSRSTSATKKVLVSSPNTKTIERIIDIQNKQERKKKKIT